jgi:hypothetical protein
LLWLLTLAAASACEAKQVPAPPSDPPADVRSAPVAQPSASPLQELDRITEEDYEEQAIVDITQETLEAELDRLEAEIGK